ncbi:MAG: hypothetical protein LBD96_11640 [Treponema sp.]|jgi:hypothetical protein|nr:hypothetical protein [Treponema sp.]
MSQKDENSGVPEDFQGRLNIRRRESVIRWDDRRRRPGDRRDRVDRRRDNQDRRKGPDRRQGAGDRRLKDEPFPPPDRRKSLRRSGERRQPGDRRIGDRRKTPDRRQNREESGPDKQVPPPDTKQGDQNPDKCR